MHVSSRWCVTAVFALGALSCSDPVPPPAQGAFLATVKAASSPPNGRSCPSSVSFTYDVPNILATKPLEALDENTYLHRSIDGEDNAKISCRVAGSSSFSFNGRIMLGGRALTIGGGTLGPDKKGTAQITVTSTESLSGSLISPSANCVVEAYTVQAGGIMWASFACPSVEAPPSDYCTANGFFVLENCEQ